MKKIILFLFIFLVIFLVGCSKTTKINKEKVNEIINCIDDLPTLNEINLDCLEDIVNIKNIYNSLNDAEKKEVYNYYILVEAEAKISYIKELSEYKINNINKLIYFLINKNNLSLKDEEEILFIETEINSLSEYEKSVFDESNSFDELKNIINIFKNEVSEINELINSIPENFSLDDEVLIKNIKDKYNKLNDDNKTFVLNYNKFEEFEKEFDEFKLIENLKLGNAINYFPDVVTSNSNDVLLSSNDLYDISWECSNENLINFNNNKINVSKIYQTHKKQFVTITATVTLNSGETIVSSKEITVDPVKYTELSDTPVATYYQSTALSSYQYYNPRYKENKTLFSDKAKDVLDILYYAFGNVNSKGNIIINDMSILPELRELKQNNVRILVSIAGISSEGSGIIANLTKDDDSLALFVKNIMDTVEYCNFDGVDVDWETAGDASVQAEGLNRLLKALKEEMIKRQDENGSPYLLTAALPATNDSNDPTKFDLKTINKYVDYVNMMSYELQMSNQATHGSALYSSSYDNGRGYSCDYAVKMFIQNGLDINKIILGVSSYGKTFQLLKKSDNTTYPGLAIEGNKIQLPGAPNAYATGTVFLVAIQYAISTGRFKKYIEYNKDNQLVGSYLYSETDNIFITYDSEEIIEGKYKYASAYEGMGIMNWAYTQDTYDSYIETIYNIKQNTN